MTAPMEKKTERAVTRYRFSFGTCSSKSVPSVGIDPYKVVYLGTKNGHLDDGEHTPTELPRKKRAMHIVVKEFENEANSPNNAVKNNVALNAALRPRRSEPGFEIVINSHTFCRAVKRHTSPPTNGTEHHPGEH